MQMQTKHFYEQQCRTYATIVSYICLNIKVNIVYGSIERTTYHRTSQMSKIT